MKKILLSIFTIAAMALTTFGQAPEGFKYQAVVRDAGNAIIANQAVGMQLTIQQGSAGGTALYTETFSPTTNAYGLVNLEIGTGTTTDDFTTIDWSNGTYFIETAIDALGGTNYSVMGTSQLMSVPYALYAKTSGNGAGPQGPAGADGTNGVDGQDGAVGAQGPAGANGIDGQDGAVGAQGPAGANGIDGVDGTNGTDGAVGAQGPAGVDGTNGIDGQDGAVGAQGPAGATGPQGPVGPQGPGSAQALSVSTTGDTLYLQNGGFVIVPGISMANGSLPAIGDNFQGGIVFYLDGNGGGLIAASTDQSAGAQWGCLGISISGADGTAIGTGNQNTTDIEQGCTTAGTAADICANLTLGGYSDWFLPSKDELNEMYLNIGQGNALGLGNIGGFSSVSYWSSTEFSYDNAWTQIFSNGFQYNYFKNGTTYVRSVRAF